jgi:4-hydroxy-tetrahydrodipicolinate synthase
MKKLAGIVVPIVTPFDQQERFMPDAFAQIVDFLIEKGIQSIFIAGSVGEFFALDEDETVQLIQHAVKVVAGRVPVLAGIGMIDTRRSIRLSKRAQDAGADLLSVLTPFYIQPNDDELFRHYDAVMSSVQIPVLGYTNPGRSGGVTISPQLARRICDRHENFIGLKDSSGNISLLKEYVEVCPPGFVLFTGMDTIVYDAVLNNAAGAVCGLGNIAPQIILNIYHKTCTGDLSAALHEQQKIVKLRATYRLGTFPAVVKEAMNMLGLPAGITRSPVGPLTPRARDQLRKTLEEVLEIEVTNP